MYYYDKLAGHSPVLHCLPMASYAELLTALGNQALKDKVTVAILIAADKVERGDDTGGGFNPANHGNRVSWTRRIMSSPEGAPKEAVSFFPLVVVANRDATLAEILAQSDAAVQTNVEEVVDLFADGT